MAWMSETEAAAVLGVSGRTIRRRVGNGSLRAIRQGQQILVDIELGRMADGNREAPSPETTTGLLVEPEPVHVAETVTPPQLEPVPTAFSLDQGALPALAGAVYPTSLELSGTRPQKRATNRRKPSQRWTVMVVWALATLLLSSGAITMWVHQRGKLEVQQVQAQFDQASRGVQQAQEDHRRQLGDVEEAARRREASLTSELAELRTRMEKSANELKQQREEATQLQADLRQLAPRLTEAIADRQAARHEQAVAEMALAAVRGRNALATALDRFADVLTALESRPEPRKSEANLPGPAPEIVAESRSGDRILPAQPPRLDGNETAPALRSILAPRTQ